MIGLLGGAANISHQQMKMFATKNANLKVAKLCHRLEIQLMGLLDGVSNISHQQMKMSSTKDVNLKIVKVEHYLEILEMESGQGVGYTNSTAIRIL